MYCSFYGINEKPFSITPDPKYLYLGRTHQQAFAHLVYGIRERGGFIVVTGGIGTGKTTLCRALLTHLDADTRVAFIFNPTLSALELLRCINEDFEIGSEGTTKKELIDELNRFLLEKKKEGKNTVLIIDEAQNLEMEVLEHIRLLSNLETDTEKLLQIILVGQPEFRQMLEQPRLLQLNQRITVRYHLTALSKEETDAYVRHRLAIAGADEKIRFTPAALRRVRRYTKGVPRLINVLCDRALLAGYSRRTREIDGDIIKHAYREISGEDGGESYRRFLHGIRAVGLPGVLIVVLLALIGYGLHTLRPEGDAVPLKRGAGYSGSPEGMGSAMAPSGFESSGRTGAYPAAVGTGMSSPRGGVGPSVVGWPEGEAGDPGDAVASAPRSREETALGQGASDVAGWGDRLRGMRASLGEQTIQQSRIEAFLGVVEQWNGGALDEGLRAAALDSQDMYSAAKALGFQIYRVQGDFETIRLLDLPAVMGLRLGDIFGTRYVALVGLHGTEADIGPVVTGASGRFPEPLLEDLWLGTAYVLWKDWSGGRKILTAGMRGEDVSWLQSALKELGYIRTGPTGVFDADTRAAMGDFQRDYGLEADGVLGPETKIVLFRALRKYPLPSLEGTVSGGPDGGETPVEQQ